MSKMKYFQDMRNPQTGEEVRIEAATEESLKNKCDKQAEKWDKENRAEDARLRVKEINEDLEARYGYLRKLCYVNLCPITPDSYIKKRISDLHRVSRSKPILKEYQKMMGPNIFLKAGGWVSDKLKSKAEFLQKEAQEQYEKDLKGYEEAIKKDNDKYNEERKRKLSIYTEQMERLPAGDKQSACAYFSYVLNKDVFSVDGIDRYNHRNINVDYYKKARVILCAVQLPLGEEIPIIYCYQYNEKKDSIEEKNFNSKDAQMFRLRIAESIMLRKAALVFLSDKYDLIDSVALSGYILYHDPAYEKPRKKVVIRLEIGKKDFSATSLEAVDVYDLFNRVLGAKIASGLYLKEPYELNEVYPYE